MKPVIVLSLFISFLFSACKKSDISEILTGIAAANDRAVGVSANDLLAAGKYGSLKVEVQYMTGFAPDGAALNHLQQFLSTYLNKPDGITVVTKEISASANATMDVNEVANVEKQNRSVFTSDGTMAVYVLYTNGNYTDNSVLGIAYRNTSVVLFGKNIHDHSGGIGQASRTKLEATVLEHEFAHLLGLVDIGTPMVTPHKDAAHGNHCSNTNCLMYYASETTDVLGFLITGNIPGLDADCVNDLKGNGGK
jgi:hypothetical protein